jgi:predicted GNAT family acetyltransferase
MEYLENTPSLTSETITGRDLSREMYDEKTHLPKTRFLPKEEGGVFHYSPLDRYSGIHDTDTVFSTVRSHGEIVGIAKMQQSPYHSDVLWLMSVSVDNKRKGEGFSKKLLTEVFAYAKRNGKKIELSKYTHEGEERLKHQIGELAQRFNVEVIPAGGAIPF